MAGLLDTLFGNGQAGFGPSERFAANYAPGVYSGMMDSQKQQAIYNAMKEAAGPEQAMAMAKSPEYLGMGGQAYMKSPAQVDFKQNPYTSAWEAMATGRGPGGVPYASQLPMGAPPGTTASPTPQGAAQQQPAGDLPTQIEAARNAGDKTSALIKKFVPLGIQGQVEGLISGKILPDQIKGQTGEAVKKLVTLVDPTWNETKAAGANEWIKKYMGGDVRDSLQATGTSLEALNAVADKALELKNADVYNSYLSSGLNKIRQASGPEAVAANEFNTANHALAQNIVKMMSGSKRPVGQATINDWKDRLGSGQRPVEMAGAMGGLIDEVESRIKELEQERDARVGSPGDYPIKPAGYDQAIQGLRQKVELLRQSKSNPGSPLDVLSGKGFNAEAAPAGGGWTNFRVGK